MEEPEKNMNCEDVRKDDSLLTIKKPKKRSLVERELETNMTARVTSPAAFAEGLSTSRYGRARRLKTDTELIESQKILLATIKSPGGDKSPASAQSPVYRMHASNSPCKSETPKKASVNIDNQINNIYQENISLSRFSDESATPSPAKKFPKVYIRKDLIQNREEEETIMLIKNLFSPTRSASKALNTNLGNSSVDSTKKYNEKQNGLVDNSSVVKTLDFDGNKKKKKGDKDQKGIFSKNELFELEAKCPYQVGDLAWARVGTFPFWPCIVTRDPYSEMFVKKKLFGRVEHDIIHVTFFGDNGRRSWIVDNMLRKYLGQLEFEASREMFTPEDKKKDPRLHAAFFVSHKKQALWNTSVEEAEALMKEPKRLRIDIFNDMLWKSRATKKTPKSGKICSRTNSDVSLSESLYDSLFSEKEVKADNAECSKIRNKSFDVSEVVTACLDNMAAKTGITKIQRQSHMDRWLQKAKSKTPEKTQAKSTALKSEKPEKAVVKPSAPMKLHVLRKSSSTQINTQPEKPEKAGVKLSAPVKLIRKSSSTEINTKSSLAPSVSHAKPYRFRRPIKTKNDSNMKGTSSPTMNNNNTCVTKLDVMNSTNADLNDIPDVSKLDSNQDISNVIIINDDDNTTQSKDEPIVLNSGETVNDNCQMDTVDIKPAESITDTVKDTNQANSVIISTTDDPDEAQSHANNENVKTNEKNVDLPECLENETRDISSVDNTATFFQPKCDFNAETQTIQDTKLSETVKHMEEVTSASVDVSTKKTNANNTHPIELAQEKMDISIEEKSIILVPNINWQNSSMDDDKNTYDVESVQDKCMKSFYCESANESVVEVAHRTVESNESQTNGNTSSNFETVSNKSVDVNVVTDLKEPQNVVTIEVSVTEKKNDDTLNNLLREGEQESINKLSPSRINRTKKDTKVFLDIFDSLNEDDMIAKKNTSTPEKYERPGTTFQQAKRNSTKKLNLESNITYSDSEYSSSTKHVLMENGVSCDDDINGQNKKILESRNETLNESSDSESILKLCNNDPTFEKGETILDTFSDSIKSESILESSQANECGNKNLSLRETAETIRKETEYVTEEHKNSSARQYIESPTFTQLLDSEEFFRDVNETDNNPTNLESDNSKENPKPQAIIINEVVKSVKSNNITNFYEDEDTSEDEPSPEYESLDDEITEDFRNHMMSIESNIKDKKDDEQIVKICNEIAEKAKQSPTKYTQQEDMFKPKANLDTISTRAFADMGTSRKEENNVNLKNNGTTHLTKVNTSTLDEHHIRVDKQTEIDIQTDLVPENYEDHKIHSIKVDSNATLHEISNKPKITYKTRSSVTSKECASPDIKIESSKVEQYRKSCGYEPKVVIIRLERDKVDYALGISKVTLLDEENSKYNNKTQISFSDSLNDNHIETKIEEDQKNKKSRLSLRRDSPKSKQTEKQIFQNQSKIKVDKPEKLTLEVIQKKRIVTANKISKKTETSNDTCKTGIPESGKLNGYHRNLERKPIDTPDMIRDKDFDVDTVSENSEDTVIAEFDSVHSIPRRNLRSRPDKTLEYALNNIQFLKYLESKQDYVMDLHPELNEDEVVSFVHKLWLYDEDLKSDGKKIDDTRNSLKQESPSRNKKAKKSQHENNTENDIHETVEKSNMTYIDFISETGDIENHVETVEPKQEFTVGKVSVEAISVEDSTIEKSVSKPEISFNQEILSKKDTQVKRKKHSKCRDYIDLATEHINDTLSVKDECNDKETVNVMSEENLTPRRSSRSKMTSKTLDREIYDVDVGRQQPPAPDEKLENDGSICSEDSEIPLRQLRSRDIKECNVEYEFKKEVPPVIKVHEVSETNGTVKHLTNDEVVETAFTVSDKLLVKQKKKISNDSFLEDPGFIQYLKSSRDRVMEENPQLTEKELVQYVHKSWLYGERSKPTKNDELKEPANLVKGLNSSEISPSKKVKRKPKTAVRVDDTVVVPREKPRRRIAQPFYNENYSDIEDELEVFEIFKTNKTTLTVVSKTDTEIDKSPKGGKKRSPKVSPQAKHVESEPEQTNEDDSHVVEYVDETELYFTALTKSKPNVFKGLIREKVCEICECAGSLVKCKGCYGMFHPDCVKKQTELTEKMKEPDLPLKGRKKKRKPIRKQRSLEDSESQSDEKSHDMSEDTSVEEVVPPELCAIDADYFESQIEVKMKTMITAVDTSINYDSYSSDDGIDWSDSVPGKCEIVDVKLKRRDPPVDYSDYRCNFCQQHDVPVCFVCKSALSKSDVKMRQKCHVAHCHRYYHLECLHHWPQTHFNSGEPSRNNKKKNQFFEALTCPRHVCHTCVSDDPRGCKTRFSGDKLAKCVRCPATYHAFNKCLPAGSQVLTASQIICPRHSEQRAGRIPCHVNTGWCFICAQGGSLICCEYCPTSFHAECLNISPPEGNYMCEDCETGRLPLYGEMVWVKLGQYRWWPAIILHPSEIPENIMLVNHELGDFVVRFFGQYDHFWVNRGRVFPYQEGDSGRISSQKSKINADFILAIEHAQRAFNILKNAEPDEEESLDIASSLLPPHYVKLKSNKASGSLCGRKIEDPSLSLTQCECNPDEPDPCGPYSQCLNRMLLTECGPTCRAGERCNNRAFERRLYPRLAPRRATQRGWGLHTLEHIKAGQFVIEYVGELIDMEEFRRRMRRKHEIRDENFYFLTLDKERMIDAGPKGNVARFMNHCCEPNCETQKWTVLGDVRVGLFAIDDIPANSEVTFNYNLECAGIEKKRCLCGAKRCSGYIGAKPKQDESQSKKVKDGKLKRTYNKKKKPEESPTTGKLKRKLGRPPKPKELTELEKDVLIIKNATHLSSDESSRTDEKNSIAKRSPVSTDQESLCNGQEEDKTKTLKRKRISISTEEVSICNGMEPRVKKLKCEKPSEVGD